MTVDADVFVVGAGPAGLAAAYCLTRKTSSVIVIERDPVHVGGLARTVQHQGFQFDIGGQRLTSTAQEIPDLWHELPPDDFSVAGPPHTRIFRNGKYYPYPLTGFETLKNLGALAGATCAMSYVLARVMPIADPRSFHEHGRNQLGERLFRTFFKTHAEKVWGMSCDNLSADWAAQCIRELNLRTSARHALRRSLARAHRKTAKGAANSSPTETFRYPRKGAGTLWDAAVRKIQEGGGRVLMGRDLRRLSYDAAANAWRIEVATASTVETYTAHHIVSSVPVRDLVDLLASRPISYFQARALRYRDLVTIALMTKMPDAFAQHTIHVHDHSLKVGRVRNLKALSDTANGNNCIGLEYFCFEGDELWKASDHELIALARSEIARIGLLAEADIVDGCVVRQPKAYPIYDEDYRHNMAMIRLDFETHYPTLHLIGRNGMHRHHDQDQAMTTGKLTAQNILAGEKFHDVWGVNDAAEYEGSRAGSPAMPHDLAASKLAHELAA